jgi:hypothetical protein
MAVNSVSSATNAAQQLLTEQLRQASQVRQTNEAKESEGAKQDNEAAEGKQPSPVVNAQGQMTGTLVNITA